MASVQPAPPAPPAVTPPPPATGQAVAIFPSPSPGDFATVGTTAKPAVFLDPNSALGAVSSADADLPHIRYTSAGTYEVQLPGQQWDQLTLYGQGTDGTVLNNGNNSGGLLMVISGSKDHGYSYSEVARYRSGDTDQIGAFAFGMLTPAGAVPTTGSASYSGTVMGASDVVASDMFDGPNRADVFGTVSLNFDFGSGSLSGAMTIGLNDAAGDPLSLGTFNFADAVYAAGSTSYSGKFDTSASGTNFFLGRFTGPHAEETIGAWALPFVLDVGNTTIAADHKTHQLFGAWIAKQH